MGPAAAAGCHLTFDAGVVASCHYTSYGSQLAASRITVVLWMGGGSGGAKQSKAAPSAEMSGVSALSPPSQELSTLA